jgi:2-oxo-3-hexenedioate decarboxylase
MANIQEIAQSLHQAAHQAKPITQISLEQSLTLDQAYEVQKELIQLRLNEGETLIGLKMGKPKCNKWVCMTSFGAD